MNVYIYAADTYCEGCGQAIRDRLTAEGHDPAKSEDEHTYDSDDFPKGPYADGGGEADGMHHCGACGVCLGNPLTQEGVADALAYLTEYAERGRGDAETLDAWEAELNGYGLNQAGRAVLRAYRAAREGLDEQQLRDARTWVADCEWGDLEPEDVATLSSARLLRGIRRHYGGGLVGFMWDE
jgi:hypothetical protein